MILKNSLWRQKTEEKEPGLLEWVKTPYLTSHHTAHSTAPHIPWHCNTTSLHSLPTATNIPPIQLHRTYHSSAHPATLHIPRCCTSHSTTMHIPLYRTSHTSRHTAPTSHYTAHPTSRPAKANIFLVLKPGHLLFTGPACLAWQKIPVHTKDLAFLILSPCSICV